MSEKGNKLQELEDEKMKIRNKLINDKSLNEIERYDLASELGKVILEIMELNRKVN